MEQIFYSFYTVLERYQEFQGQSKLTGWQELQQRGCASITLETCLFSQEFYTDLYFFRLACDLS